MTHLTPNELAARWRMHPGTLSNWRQAGRGPAFIKVGSKVLYPLSAVEAWERQQARETA
jgi:hypothetical protein